LVIEDARAKRAYDFPQTAPTMVRPRCRLGGWQGWAWKVRRRACRSGACGCR